jgi:hypothetical protein
MSKVLGLGFFLLESMDFSLVGFSLGPELEIDQAI